MKKLQIIFIIACLTSCKTTNKLTHFIDDEKLSIYKENNSNYYNMWGFNSNGESLSKNKASWNTRNINYTDSTLVSNGIYENSGRFKSEKAIVYDNFNDFNSHSILIRFKISPTSKSKKYIPILVRGKYYRNIKIFCIDNEIKISVNGNFNFTIPNQDIEIKKMNLIKNRFNTLYLAWDINKHVFKVSINNQKEQKIKIPSDFTWNKMENCWTIQDFSNGSAFSGELDYFISINKYISKKEIINFIKSNH